MKLVAFILGFISVSFALISAGEILKSIYEKFVATNGCDKVVVNNLIESKAADDENGKCFRDCIMRECNYFGYDGKLNPDVPQRLASILHGGKESNVKPIEGKHIMFQNATTLKYLRNVCYKFPLSSMDY